MDIQAIIRGVEAVVAIAGLVVLLYIAALKGIDHAIFATGVALIAGLGGYKLSGIDNDTGAK